MAEDLNQLIQTDSHFEDPEFLIDVPPATNYICIFVFSPDFLEQVATIGEPEKLESMQTCPSFVRYYAAVTEHYQVILIHNPYSFFKLSKCRFIPHPKKSRKGT